jgi:flagellar protein FliO/FliZ
MIDIPTISLYAGAAVVLAIVLLIIVLLARSRGGGIRTRYGQRLGVSEFHDIDKLRRLILIRRDGVEHLLLIGPNQDLVIESSIAAEASKLPLEDEAPLLRRSPQRLEPAVENNERGEPPPFRPRMAPRPAVFGDRAPNLRSVEPEGPQLTSVRGDIDSPDR